MRKQILAVVVAIMVLGIGVGSASAAYMMKAGSAGINVDVNDGTMITGKVFVMPSLAILAGFGLGVNGGDTSGTDIGVMVGARKYLKMEDFAPFVGGTVLYTTAQKGDQKEADLLAEAGAEYFFYKQFSVEGKIGFGYLSTEQKIGNATIKNNTVGTKRYGVSFNYYFF
jgi:hypothetical protein